MNPQRCLAVLALVLLAGCSGFRSRESADEIYLLQVAPAAVAATVPVAATLAVLLPGAAPGLDGDRIALQTVDGRMGFYGASRWSGELPMVMQTMLLDSLRNAGAWRAVLADGAPFSTDLLLQTEIRHFQAEYPAAGTPTAHVVLEATLGQRGSRAIVRSIRAESRVAARADRMSDVVTAFNAALNEALTQLRSSLTADPAPR